MQTGEIIIIALLALVVLGPRRLPEMARKAGQWAAELRRAARDITAGLEAEVAQFQEIGRDLREPLEDLNRQVSDLNQQVSDLNPGKFEWKGPKPLSGPTPEDAMRDYEQIHGETPSEEPEAEPGQGE